MASIQITTPDGQAYDYHLAGDRFTVGRGDDNSISIPDSSVSTNHGEFINEGGQWAFIDLGSTNGTKVEGNRLDRVELVPGAQFEIGDCPVYFYEEEQAAPEPMATAAPTARRAAVSTVSAGGYADQAIDRAARVGFGAKKKVPDGGRGGIMALGIVALLAILAIAAMIWTQGLL
jgi:predicted component of type VI protein secretion system